ncbi:MAG: hypothetical protein AAF632_07055 [Bacteroidota bacterium]
MKVILPLTLVLLLFGTVGFSQTTYYVSLSGDDANDGSIGSPWLTVQHAIDNAVSGDIIRINPGAYDEIGTSTLTIDKSLTLEGIGSGITELADLVLISTAVSDVTLQTLTLGNTGGIGNSLVVNGSNATVQNCFIDGTVQINSGGASLTLTNNDFNTTGTAVNNNSSNTVNATYNWWNSNAIGDITLSITDASSVVDYSPWLNLDIDTDGTTGFQPNTSSISIYGDSPGGGNLQDVFNDLEPGDTLRLVESTTAYGDLEANRFIAGRRKDIIISTIDGQEPIINSVELFGDSLKIDGNLQIASSISLPFEGVIKTLEGSQVSLGTGVTSVNEDGGRLKGDFITKPRNVGTDPIKILGVDIASGTDDIGNVIIRRRNGDGGINTANGSESIAVTWNIDVDNEPASGRALKLSWRSENDNGSDAENVRVWRFDETAGEWELMSPVAIDATTGSSTLRTATVGMVMEFSPWTVSDDSQPLPVVLTDFTARLERPSVRLEWATASETNADFFSIERSTDGLSFEEVGRNQAAGESSDIRNYRYVDEGVANRLTGTLYYRLRIVDFDESYEYSNTVAVPLSTNNDLRLRADAKQGTIQMFTEHLPVGQYWIQVSDMAGNILAESPMKTTEDISTFSLPLNTPASGVYLLRCIGTRNLYIQKFRIE